jgi:xanthine dehydrogenase accessory factor
MIETGGRPQLVIFGAEKTGKILAALAHLMNFGVTMIDPSLTVEEAPGADRVLHDLDFSRLPHPEAAFVVIASGGRFDEEAAELALRSGVRYIALVANRKRSREVLNRVAAKGIDTEMVRSKAGVDIGAEGPEEIALSIMAEIIAERHHTRVIY